MQNQTKSNFNMKPIFKGAMVLTTILLIVGGVLSYRTLAFVNKAVETTAIVIKNRSSMEDGGTIYFPTFQFKDEHGNNHLVEVSFGSKAFRYKVGASIPILYNPNKPAQVRIKSFTGVWFVTVIVDGLALGIVILSLGFWRAMRIFEKKQRESMKTSS